MYREKVIKMQIEEMNEIRKQRGMEIVHKCRIMKREKGGYVVPSQSGEGAYLVRFVKYKPVCECQDFEKRGILGVKCKHIWAVEITINKQVHEDGSTTTTITRKTYSQHWHEYDQAQIHQKEKFLELLSDLCNGINNPTYTFGRPTLPLSDMVFASALKVFSTFSLRRFMTDMRTAKEKGYCDKVSCYSSVSNYMRNPEMTSVLLELIQKSSLPLKNVETDFGVDSSGFSTCRFDRWYSFKWGREVNSRVWIKAHLINGVKTHIVTGVKITKAHENDCPQFPELVEKTAENFEINEVLADKAYSSRDNISLVKSLGGTAFIPFKSNATSTSRGSTTWNKMYHYFMLRREEFLIHYHQRSNSETVFHMIKSKFDDSVRSKEWVSQVNEVLLKVLCHNICVVIQEMNELGIEANFNENNNVNI